MSPFHYVRDMSWEKSPQFTGSASNEDWSKYKKGPLFPFALNVEELGQLSYTMLHYTTLEMVYQNVCVCSQSRNKQSRDNHIGAWHGGHVHFSRTSRHVPPARTSHLQTPTWDQMWHLRIHSLSQGLCFTHWLTDSLSHSLTHARNLSRYFYDCKCYRSS